MASSSSVNDIDEKNTRTSKYLGVYSVNRRNKTMWCAQSRYEGKKITLGCHDNEEDAAKLYDTYKLVYSGPTAKINGGFVTYDEVKDIPIESLLSKKKKRDFPEHIIKKGKSYQVNIMFDNQRFIETRPSLEEAVEALKNIKISIEKMQEEKDTEHNSKEILRDENGNAIIQIKNNKNNVVDNVIVDDSMWHKLMKHSWSVCKEGLYKTSIDSKTVMMHKYIKLGVEQDKKTKVIHIDGNVRNNKARTVT